MSREVHMFDNGIKVYSNQLLKAQKERYLKHNIHEAEEEPIFIELIQNLNRNATYVNVGAAIGYYSILAKTLRNDLSIIAYEPLKQHIKYFYENIDLNNMKGSDFKIYQEGLYSSNGHETFIQKDYSSMIQANPDKRTFVQTLIEYIKNERIKTVTLERVWEKVSTDIDLLQMDIQGLELPVLESSKDFLKKHQVKNILLGTHSTEIHSKCKDILIASDYNIVIDNYDTKLQPDGILLAIYNKENK